jgi:acyl-CoA synthetase (AMP-forming)/AMP-acid ligase II
MNISNNLENASFHFPNRPALNDSGLEITYLEFNERANRVATGLLALGVKLGEHIGPAHVWRSHVMSRHENGHQEIPGQRNV